jgi:hypothetical protein
MRDKNPKNLMNGKIQGEGDYEAARRFNRQEQEFVRRKYGKHKVTADFDPEEMADREAHSRGDQPASGSTERDDANIRRRIIGTPRSRH